MFDHCERKGSQQEIDLLFDTLVLPNITYALSVYAASKSDLTPIEFKRKYTSKPVSVHKLLEKHIEPYSPSQRREAPFRA